MMAESLPSTDLLDLPDEQETYYRKRIVEQSMTIRRYRLLLKQWVDSPIFSLTSRDAFVPAEGLVPATMRALAEAE